MAESKVEIANSALVKIGESPIQSFDDNVKAAQVIDVRYDPVRRAVLRMHPWNCAIKRVVLSPLSTSPAFGYDSQFQLPADCLRVLEPDWVNDPSYRIEGRTIQIDTDEINLKYLYDLEDTSQMDVLLSETIGAYLAFDIAYAITQRDSVRDAMFGIFTAMMSRAVTTDAQEDSRVIIDGSDWEESRLGTIDDRRGK